MELSISDFRDLMEGIQSLALTIAAIGAGIWALFTFNALRLREKARAEIERINTELEKARAEIERIDTELKQQAVIDIAVSADQLAIPDDDSLYMNVEVTVENVGNRNTHLQSAHSPLIVEEMRWNGDSVSKVEAFVGFDALDYVLRVGNRQTFPYIVRVDRPGLYRVLFAVELSGDEMEVAKAAGQPEPTVFLSDGLFMRTRICWTGEKYFVVKPLTSRDEPAVNDV